MTINIQNVIALRQQDDSPMWIEQPDAPPRALRWEEIHNIPERWAVADPVPGGLLSTVFLGIRTYGGHLYETAYFPDDPDAHVSIVARYRTRAQAEAAHASYRARWASTTGNFSGDNPPSHSDTE